MLQKYIICIIIAVFNIVSTIQFGIYIINFGIELPFILHIPIHKIDLSAIRIKTYFNL